MDQRQTVDLSGIWRFNADPHRDGEELGFARADRTFPLWREARVPSCFEAACPDIDFYQGVCWYRRSFRPPVDWRGRRITLHFEAVNYVAKVWLNGQLLGENRDGFLPFEFEVTGGLLWDRDNIVAISVDNAHHEGDVPGMHVGWRAYGGITREVSLRATSPRYIENVRILAAPNAGGGEVELAVTVRNAGATDVEGVVAATIRDSGGAVCLTLSSQPLAITPGGAAQTTLRGGVPAAKPWSPQSPTLYRAKVSLSLAGAVEDERGASFGFRRIEATPDGLLLNGRKIFLTGFNRHEDSPRTAMATDLAVTRRDLEQMKEAGANLVRLCHYPHHPAELDLCDELGLLAFCEIPLYFLNSVEEGLRTNAERVRSGQRQLERMIARDFNHPSVIFWSVSNETNEENPPIAEANRELIRRARQIDPSRLCVHVSNHWFDRPNFEADSVICINAYPTMDFGARGHSPATFDLAGALARYRELMATLHRNHPSKPILVTEFGYSSFAGTFGQSFGEDEHAKSLEAEFPSFDAPYFCGAVIWCWADHPWPGGRFFDGLTMSPFGVVNRQRRPLAPYWTARKLFRARQDMPPAAPSQAPDDTTLIMVRPDMDNIPQAQFPPGYGIRAMTLGDTGLWTDIQRDAEPYLTIGDDLFRQEFGDDLEAVAWRCFIVTDPKGLGVGTISAWYNRDWRGREHGRIHWVAVRPRCQRQGLARAALSFAMNRMAQWHDCCYLVTSTQRTGAIALYRDFGFEPR